MNLLKKSKTIEWLMFAILTIFLLSISFHYHKNEINKYPSYIHAWAQADHYALALGFTENGYDFFHPQTYNLNKQFPNNFNHPYETAVTSADFPIHAYIPALLMGLTGSSSPFWMRIYLLTYSLIGLLFLYLLTKQISKNYLAPFITVAFATLSPVFLYYQATFIPTIPSLANAIIGYYFYIKYLNTEKDSNFWLALGFMTLATLARTPFAIFLIAIICQECLYFIQKRKISGQKCLGFSISVAIILGYFLYNQILRAENGSIFLGSLQYPDSFETFKAIFSEVVEKWGNHYFTKWHYLFFSLLLLGYIVQLVRFGKEKELVRGRVGLQLLIASFGATLYSVVMTKQFIDHDYYILDSLFLPFILTIAFFTGRYSLNSKIEKGLAITTIIAFVTIFQLSAHKQVKSRQQAYFWDKIELINQTFADSDQLLDSMKISRKAVILVLDAQAPNSAFVHMKRPGYGIRSSNKEEIENALGWNFDYVAIQNCYLYSEVANLNPAILNTFERVGGNDNITILKRSKEKRDKTAMDILGLTTRIPNRYFAINFDTLPAGSWNNTLSIKDPTDSTNTVGYTASSSEWGLTLALNDSTLRCLKSTYALFHTKFFSEEKQGKIYLMANYEIGKKSISQQVYEFNLDSANTGKWRNIDLIFPANKFIESKKENRYTIFIWNVEKKEVVYDDVSITIY